MSRGLVQEFTEETREQDMFDFVLDGEEEDNYTFQQSQSGAGKDDDSVKLFIGQIPKDMDEDTLRPYFAEFGPIFELTVIRDKTTRIHRGCAFLTFCHKMSALHAVEQLHDKIKLPNAVNPLQVRPAESQAERENKLFIGMLPKTVTEEDLDGIFSQYGELREVHVIRGTDGHSKGCAFIKFMDRDSAMVAIDCMHDTTPEGSTRPLVVKFADNKKAVKGKVGGVSSPPGTPPSGGSVPLIIPAGILSPSQTISPEYWSLQQGQNQQQQVSGSQFPYTVSAGQTVGQGVSVPPSQQQQMMSVPYIAAYPSASGTPSYLYYQSPVSMYSPYNHAPNSPGYSSNNSSSDAFSQQDPRLSSPLTPQMQQQGYRMPMQSGSDQSRTPAHHHSHAHSQGHSQVQSHVNSRPPEGPSGANLFIYHLPRDLTDADLATLFASFGNVISAKVYVDKKTAESKGFGFVSYDSVSSAEEAINTMNGFQIGSKRLKVQHKRSGSGGFDMMGVGMGGAVSLGASPDRGAQGPGGLNSAVSHGHGMPVTNSVQAISYPVMSSAGMGEYGQAGLYGIQGGYPDASKGAQFPPNNSTQAGRGQQQQSQQLGVEEQFMQMAISPSQLLNGASTGGSSDSRRNTSGATPFPIQQPQQQLSIQFQQQQPTQSQQGQQLPQQQQQQDFRYR